MKWSDKFKTPSKTLFRPRSYGLPYNFGSTVSGLAKYVNLLNFDKVMPCFFFSSLKYRKVTFPPKLRSKYKLATTLRVKNSRLQGCCPYRDSLTRFGGLYRIEFHKSHSGLAIGSANSVVSVIKLISYLDSKKVLLRAGFEPAT